MSHSSSPTNRNSIFGWVKNLKKSSFLSNDSVDEITDSENNLESSNVSSPISSKQNNGYSGNTATPITMNNQQAQSSAQLLSTSPQNPVNNSPELLRPNTLVHQRSSNNIRSRYNSSNQNESQVRQHRDSFLQNNNPSEKYFGVPLEEAINQASAKINVSGSDEEAVQYGHIPLVVAKCAIFIKANGLNVEGIFRVSGSSKRLKELQTIFNTSPEFGKKLDWEGYTVHDASSMLRRYLNALPEPLIPLDLYEEFREPLMERQRIIKYLKFRAENPKSNKKSDFKNSAVDHIMNNEKSELTEKSEPRQKPIDSQPVESKPGELSLEASEAAKILKEQAKINSEISSLTEIQSSHENPNNNHVSDSLPQPITNMRPTNNEYPNPNITNSSPTVSSSYFVISENTNHMNSKNHASTPEERRAKKARTYKNLIKEVHEAIELYKVMVEKLPPLSKQLLFYILDLLSMVQENSEVNLMSSRNLAAIFQPSILSHPNHDLNPVEYALSQAVVEFLISYSYKLLPERGAKRDQQGKAAAEIEKNNANTNNEIGNGNGNGNENGNENGSSNANLNVNANSNESGKEMGIEKETGMKMEKERAVNDCNGNLAIMPNSNSNRAQNEVENQPQITDAEQLNVNVGSEKTYDNTISNGLELPHNRVYSGSVSSNQSHPEILRPRMRKLSIVDSENEINSIDFDSDDNYSNLNKSNLTLDSTYHVDAQNIDTILRENSSGDFQRHLDNVGNTNHNDETESTIEHTDIGSSDSSPIAIVVSSVSEI